VNTCFIFVSKAVTYKVKFKALVGFVVLPVDRGPKYMASTCV